MARGEARIGLETEGFQVGCWAKAVLHIRLCPPGIDPSSNSLPRGLALSLSDYLWPIGSSTLQIRQVGYQVGRHHHPVGLPANSHLLRPHKSMVPILLLQIHRRRAIRLVLSSKQSVPTNNLYLTLYHSGTSVQLHTTLDHFRSIRRTSSGQLHI
jgi:hypothetical protein